ncbi:hypothetical protein E2C01_005642 [Portunus trituberculatus]|uniref:Uncharacterized protein n=1 Tax=Portunus trituberculatus TaxID=210409 RepID=A0A5B7CX57_PORTR|nr:hypothetical protein [Portunus trituberculatus]
MAGPAATVSFTEAGSREALLAPAPASPGHTTARCCKSLCTIVTATGTLTAEMFLLICVVLVINVGCLLEQAVSVTQVKAAEIL